MAPSVITDIVLPPPALYTLPRGVSTGGVTGAVNPSSGGRDNDKKAASQNYRGTRKDSKKGAKLSTLKKRKGSKSQTESVV